MRDARTIPISPTWLLRLILALAVLPVTSACTTMVLAGKVIDAVKQSSADDTAVSFTVQGPALVSLMEGLSQFDLEADLEAIDKGVTIVKLVGAYAEVLNAINWLIIEGTLAILANDEASELVLAVVVSLMKSGF